MERDQLPSIAFGQIIRELRETAGLTQQVVGEKFGSDRAHVSALERARQGPSIATIFSIANSLQVPVSTLMEQVETRLATLREDKS